MELGLRNQERKQQSTNMEFETQTIIAVSFFLPKVD